MEQELELSRFSYSVVNNSVKGVGIMEQLSPRNTKVATLYKLMEPLGWGSVVVEIGSIRYSEEVTSDDGWSTVYLASKAEERKWQFHSIDDDPQAIQIATTALLKKRGDRGQLTSSRCLPEWMKKAYRAILRRWMNKMSRYMSTLVLK